MKVYVAQFYIGQGSYPFSHHFQKFISEEITERVTPSTTFIEMYADDFDLMFRMSAKSGLHEPEVRGPTVFAKEKDVEYTIFLSYDGTEPHDEKCYRRILHQLIDAIARVLSDLDMDVSALSAYAPEMIERIVADPNMTKD